MASKLEAALRAKQEWEQTFDAVPDLLMILDQGSRIVRANQAMAGRLGISPPECVGLRCYEAVHGLEAPPEFCPHRQTLEDGQEHEIEVHEPRAGGDFLVTTTPLHDAEGRLVGTVHVARDISARKRVEAELAQAKAAAEAANAAKSRFLANMSHELRTPMNAILGMTDLALQEEISPTARDCLLTAMESAHSLHDLLNEILDYSSVESGTLSIERTALSLRSVLTRTLRPLEPRATQKGLEMRCEVPADLPDRLVGDPLRIRQVLTNLVANAIKFTEAGEIVVGARAVDVDAVAGEILLELSVSDTGIGISDADQERIFSAFTQADASMTRPYGGSGLGLTVARRIVELMGGRLVVESCPGEGSTFRFAVRFGLLSRRRDEGQSTPPPLSAPA